mgnify:CR=1 FL=1
MLEIVNKLRKNEDEKTRDENVEKEKKNFRRWEDSKKANKKIDKARWICFEDIWKENNTRLVFIKL